MSAPAPKPFSLQAPERIAMEYGGNKQKIAQAVQSGLIDPTSGLMAGMFIDRMRSAQAQEQAPNQTVAQQVLGPQGPQGGPPPGGPPQGGLGGLPPGGPPPQGAPQGGPPPPPPPQGGPPPQGPVGMAEGGLTTLPVPDYMFDEQSFAGGGIVAFRTGDAVDAKAQERKVLMTIATMGKTFAERSDAMQKLRAMDTAVDTTPLAPASELTQNRSGLLGTMQGGNPDSELPLTLQKDLASRAYNTSFTPPPEPGMVAPDAIPAAAAVPPPAAPRVDFAARARDVAKAKNVPTPTARPDLPTDAAATPDAPVETLETLKARVKKLYGDVPTPDKTSAEDKAARKKEDFWSAMAQAGFGMMAGTSQNALTNIGEGLKAAMPTMQASLKERRADEKEERAQAFAAKIAAHTDDVSAANAAYTMYRNASKDKQDALDNQLNREVQTRGQDINKSISVAQLNKRSADENAQAIILAGAGPNATPAQQAAAKALMDYRASGAMVTGDNAQANNYAVQKAKIDDRFDASIKRETLKKDTATVARLTREKRAAMDVLNLLYPTAAERLGTPTNRIRLNAQGLPE